MARKTSGRAGPAKPAQELPDYLHKVRNDLLPAHASDFVAINMETGQYAIGSLPNEAFNRFLEQWPDAPVYLCRVDGGPAAKFHGVS